ncbi:hypothetical protein ROV67_00110 [Pasteurella multocida]|uniref:hypothetical protein n=1 Tax=Pasteurella multocida TaxID=747 RepID=UPI0007EC7747|nr:hypothetical protein [Pasteurella multocida]MCL7822645.1 hypothetical protein [Pasteurella multocida]MDY0577146.1 hypothetical protein [Pasteurella multocida]MEB3481308.1 hypothetical protein [Pasteurella multocida]MEB3502312.1 hypothetical protein [Pasteurella multocida]OBP35875.1 hypothetical protein A0R74_02340 [Pasteurella multocida subsp. multocida]
MRKIIQVAISNTEDGGETIALCDDGSLFGIGSLQKGWFRYPDIPQPMCKGEYDYVQTLWKQFRSGKLDDEGKEELVLYQKRLDLCGYVKNQDEPQTDTEQQPL